MISKNGFRLKQISSLFIVMCILLTMLPVTAFTESVYIADNSALPIHDDILEIQGGELKDGVLVIDLGDYDEFVASIANGERFPITITRPKGSEAGYQVTAMFDSYSGSNANGFRIFDTGEGDNYSHGFIEFPPNVTSKTIYVGQEYDLGDNTLRSGTLSSYIYFHTFDKTTLATPMVRLETTKEKGTGEDTTGLLPVVYAQVSDATMSVKPDESKVIAVTFLPTRNIFLLDRGFCEITDDLTLNLKRGTETLVLKPVEAIGSILSDVTFVLPPTDPISEDWEVVSITGIKNAANNDVIDLIYSDVYSESDINASTYTFRYNYEPVFGPITTDKEVYKGLENIQVSLPVQNADQINFGAEFNDYWIEQIGLSYDGVQNFIPQDSIGWNSTTKSIEATFTAPENNTGRAFDIALEVYKSYGEMMVWLGFYNAFTYIEIAPETADFIPVESITVTGIPAFGIKCDSPYPLEVAISPEDATFQGYTWQSDNPDQAQVIGGNLVFYEEGKVNITLTSEERAYRMEQALPANDDVLVKTFTFFAGAPHLITGQISVGKSDTTSAVTARFFDNFHRFQDEWKTPVLTYEIRKSDGSLVKSGNATRENDVTEVNLVFDDITPKTVSLYENGEFKPAYTITLNASTDTESVSATANVYITPPPVTMESLTEASNALVGEPSTFVFRIKNLLPGYISRYEILGGGGLEEGKLTNPIEESDPATGLITLTGSVVFTPAVQGFVSEFRTITVYANNNDEKPQAISKRINVVDQSTARMSMEFCDGLDGTIIHPESGDEPDVFYGIRESKIVELTKDSAYAAQGIFEYLNRIIPTKTLKVTVPKEWGQMGATGASNPVTDYTDISLYLSFEDIGKKITLSWENVSTTKEFTFMEDDFSGKLYAFRLVNAHSLQPVSISYKNGADQPVNKNVTPYNGYVILYEPNGIEGDVWFSQENGTGSYIFASITSVAALRKIDRSWQREYDQAPLVVSSLATNHRYITGHSTPAFTTDTVILSEPMALFSNAGNIIPTIVRYCAIDQEGKIISGTSGKIYPASGSSNFQLPFQMLYENPSSQLLVEFEYSVATGSRTQLATYDVQTLEENLRYKKVNNYVMTSSDNIQYITATGKDGQTRYLPISSNIMKKLLPEDTLEVHLATGTRAIKSASLDIVNYQPVNDNNGNISHWMPDFTVVSEATSIVEADRAELTPNKYTTLQFKPTTGQMTPGLVTQITLNIVFTDGTSDQYSLGWGQMTDTGTAKYVKLITDILKSQTFIHEEQRVLRVGDAQVMRNTRDAKVEGVKVSFNQDVAALFDKIKVDIALPPENPSNPFTFEVIPRGDEYDIRGYVNASIMNKAGWVNLTDRWANASFNDVFDATKQEVKAMQFGNFPGAKGYLEGKAA
ncbi:MAG TPA: hypothetical protein DDZ89_11060, partial [Clostridiales bacterium]|nr:hypothetical protein [Clostridiales bacterium]